MAFKISDRSQISLRPNITALVDWVENTNLLTYLLKSAIFFEVTRVGSSSPTAVSSFRKQLTCSKFDSLLTETTTASKLLFSLSMKASLQGLIKNLRQYLHCWIWVPLSALLNKPSC